MEGVVVYKRVVGGVPNTSGQYECLEIAPGSTSCVAARRESKWESCLVAIGVAVDGTLDVYEGEFADESELPGPWRVGQMINQALAEFGG